jgi:hypothetical protein
VFFFYLFTVLELNSWNQYLNLFVTHSPITDAVRSEWQRSVKTTIVASSRGYSCPDADVAIMESTTSCLSTLNELARLSPSSHINICLPHSGLHAWRFMIEHPSVSGYTYIEEGTASSLCKPFDKCLPKLATADRATLQVLLENGYSKESIQRLLESDTVFFDFHHKKYLGAIALFPSAFKGFPSRVQLTSPRLLPLHVKTLVILVPYLVSFADEHQIEAWIKRCLIIATNSNPEVIAISPHPSNQPHSELLLQTTRRLAHGKKCELLADLKRDLGIPSHTETGLLGVLGFVSPVYNSTLFYAEIARNPARRFLLPVRSPLKHTPNNLAEHLLP